jgi:hypothetical protein
MSLYNPGVCDICERKREVAVAASAWGPISEATCRECLVKPAMNTMTADYLMDSVGDDISRLTPEVKNWYVWQNGRYVHFTNYVPEKRGG